MKGDFIRTSPGKGQFRFFVKTVVRNLIRSHFRKRNRHSESPFPAEELPVSNDDGFNDQDDKLFSQSWRDDLLYRTWQSLAEHQGNHGVPYHTILHLRVSEPELNGDQFAAKLSEQIGKAIQPATARVQLHRSREKFATIMIDDVANSLDNNTRELVEQELNDLGLIEYCRPAFENYNFGN